MPGRFSPSVQTVSRAPSNPPLHSALSASQSFLTNLASAPLLLPCLCAEQPVEPPAADLSAADSPAAHPATSPGAVRRRSARRPAPGSPSTRPLGLSGTQWHAELVLRALTLSAVTLLDTPTTCSDYLFTKNGERVQRHVWAPWALLILNDVPSAAFVV